MFFTPTHDPRGCFLGKVLTQAMVYSNSEVSALADRAQEEGNGCVCSPLGLFLVSWFQNRSEFGFFCCDITGTSPPLRREFAQVFPDLGSFVVFQSLPSCRNGERDTRTFQAWGGSGTLN